MANVAIGTDKNMHYADDFSDMYNVNLFCPNVECGAKLILKGRGSSEKTYHHCGPYYSATESNPHIEGCEYSVKGLSYVELEKNKFTVDGFFDKLLNGRAVSQAGSSSAKTPAVWKDFDNPTENKMTTLKKLYSYCRQHSDNHLLPDGKRVYEIYQEKRNEIIPNSKCDRTRIIKLAFGNCNFDIYDEKYQCYNIWCYFPHTEKTAPPGIYYTIGFAEEDDSLMIYFCKILNGLKNRNGEAILIVGGDWVGNHCTVKSKRQIFILK